MVKIISDKKMHLTLTSWDAGCREGIRDACREVATDIYHKADTALQGHHVTGEARIEVDEIGKHWGVNVSLVDPAALSIEFGHYTRQAGTGGFPRFVQGLYIISRASGLV